MNTIVAAALALLPAQEAEWPDLHGKVLTETGEPVPTATVFVYTAAPRKGTSPL